MGHAPSPPSSSRPPASLPLLGLAAGCLMAAGLLHRAPESPGPLPPAPESSAPAPPAPAAATAARPSPDVATDLATDLATDPATGLLQAPGFAMVAANCTGCHSARLITQNRGDRDHWQAMIRWMQATQNLWPLDPLVEDQILGYLATNYGAASGGRRAPLPAHLLPPEPAADVGEAK